MLPQQQLLPEQLLLLLQLQPELLLFLKQLFLLLPPLPPELPTQQVLQVQQVPEYAPARYAGHEAGEFFFNSGTAI